MEKASLGDFASLGTEVSQSGQKSPGKQDLLVLVLKKLLVQALQVARKTSLCS